MKLYNKKFILSACASIYREIELKTVSLYSAANDPRRQMIPRPEMIPKLDRK